MLIHSLLFLLLLQTCSSSKQTVPVLLLDYDNVMSHIKIPANPFNKISKEIFKNIIRDAGKRSTVVIFAEENLSTEDLSTSDSLGTPFYHLQRALKQKKAIYIPAVVQPYISLKRYFRPRKNNTFNLGAVKGVVPSSHTRRSLFSQKPTVEKEVRTARSLSTTMQYTDFEMQFNFVFMEKDWKLDNVALMEGGEEVGRTTLKVGAPWNWSYSCAAPIIVANARDGSFVTIAQYQIQPIYRSVLDYTTYDNEKRDDERYYEYDGRFNKKNDYRSLNDSSFYRKFRDYFKKSLKQSFDQTVNCEPYFTITILAGLFVAVIIAIITSVGVLVLFNCEINSRFDDVNQKPLLIPEEK